MMSHTAHLLGSVAAIAAIFSNNLATAAVPPATPATAIDVALDSDGLFSGRVVDPRGQGLPEAEVAVIDDQQVVATVTTDREGFFRVGGMAAGTYQLASKRAVRLCRLWFPGTAPPSAKPSALLVSPDGVAAGQVAPLRYWLANPNVMIAIATIAVVIPIVAFNISQNRQKTS
jgi:hypothetical protein